jgi:guanosine-3',5'-bis(diphosphate) 3'-pyrophosphohydrolase
MKSIVAQAQEFSKTYHKKTTRLNGDSYYNHAQNVANILEAQRLSGENILAAAYLHEAVKDDVKVLDDIRRYFNKEVYDILRVYNEISEKHLRVKESDPVQLENTIKTLMNLSVNTSVLALRLADKVENLRTSHVFSIEDRKSIAMRSALLYAPLARFLSLGKFVRDLEDTSFKILSPQQYAHLSSRLVEAEHAVKKFFDEASIFLKDVLAEQGVYATIDYRMKSVYSTFKKLKKYNASLAEAFISIPDVVAFRVLVGDLEHCYKVLETLNSIWELNQGHFSDWISNPKANGYKSIHAVYNVTDKFMAEFQIKTHQMHEFNEYGGASYAIYKLGDNFKKLLDQDPTILERLDSKNILEGIADFKTKPIENKIYVFTPKQDIIELPKGATVIDFAYSVHEDVGRNFTGVLVNGSIARASTVLKDGDSVEIRFSKKPKLPSRDWLDFVVTSKAKSYIKKSLKHAS